MILAKVSFSQVEECANKLFKEKLVLLLYIICHKEIQFIVYTNTLDKLNY